MGATFSSGAKAQVPPSATPAPAGGDDKKMWNDDLVDSYVFVVDAAEVEARRAEKTLWPELVGMNEFDAAHAILVDRHDVRVHYYDYCKKAPPPGFDPQRVVLFIDSRFRVVNIPKVG